MKTTGYVLRPFHQESRKPTGQNIAGSFFTSRHSTPVTFDRERDAGLYGKRGRYFRSMQANTHRDLKNNQNLLSSRQHEQRA